MELLKKWEILSKRIEDIKRSHHGCFIVFDKFGTALRNLIDIVPSLQPDIIVAERGGKWDFVLENCLGKIWDTHYLDFFQIKERDFLRRLNNRSAFIFSWTRKKQFSHLWTTLCLPNNISRFIEDKVNLSYILKKAGINEKLFSLQQKEIKKWEFMPSFREIVSEFGVPFVIQWLSKWGDGTLIVQDEKDFAEIGKLQGNLRITPFCDQQYSSIYGLVIPKRDETCTVVMDRPSYKVVGVPDIGISPVFWGGADWSRIPDLNKIETIDNITKIGQFLFKNFWYIWAFVIEWFLINGHFVIHEINSRLGWWNEVSGFNQRKYWELPIQALHYAIMSWAKCDDLVDRDEFLEKHFYGQGGCFYIKILWKWEQSFSPGWVQNGSYWFDENSMQPTGTHLWTHETDFLNKNFLITNCPKNNTACAPKSHICMLEGWSNWSRPIVTGPHTVDKSILKVSQLLYNTLRHEPLR